MTKAHASVFNTYVSLGISYMQKLDAYLHQQDLKAKLQFQVISDLLWLSQTTVHLIEKVRMITFVVYQYSKNRLVYVLKCIINLSTVSHLMLTE